MSRAAIVAGDLTLADASGRNRNLRIERRYGPSYLVKRLEPGAGRGMLEDEARFHSFCREEPQAAEIRGFVPRLALYEPEEPLLAFELLAAWRPLAKIDDKALSSGQLEPYAGLLGRHLATLHRTFPLSGLAGDRRLSWLRSEQPIALGLHRPVPLMLRRLSPARRRFFRIVQHEGNLALNLDRLSAGWTAMAVIHGDVRSGNVLTGEVLGRPAVQLVDWETVQLGDPAWDIAGALQELLLLWIRGLPWGKELSPEVRVAEARVPLEWIQPSMCSLWKAYRGLVRLGDEEQRVLLLRSIAYSAAILVQTAYESSRARDRMSIRSVILLQIAARIVDDPPSALRLYGLPE